MNRQKFLKEISSLGEELNRLGNARPYDPDAYNAVIDKLNSIRRNFYSNHRSFRSPFTWLVYLLILLLAIIVCLVLW